MAGTTQGNTPRRIDSMSRAHLALLALVTLFPCALPAAGDVGLLLLSSNKAILLVDGERRVLSVGQTSPEGVTLLETGAEDALVDVGGETRRLGLRRKLETSGDAVSAPDGRHKEHRLYADRQGMFRTTGSINGQPTDFLVDTGATTIAMNASQARRLGIDFRMDGKAVQVMTASGVELSYQVRLRSVKVGPIELNGVNATVMQGDFPAQVLLGMSFLGRLESERTPTMLLLRKVN
jgi:aspartyl protease family protein